MSEWTSSCSEQLVLFEHDDKSRTPESSRDPLKALTPTSGTSVCFTVNVSSGGLLFLRQAANLFCFLIKFKIFGVTG